MEIRHTQVPGAFWILPQGHPIALPETPTKKLYIHVIPQDVTYQVLLDNDDIPIGCLYVAMLDILMNCNQINKVKDEGEEEALPNYTMYWKRDIVNTIGDELKSKEFTSGATFLVRKGETLLPTFHSGKLWQCKSCAASFNSFQDLSQHLQKMRRHQMSNFGTPTNWGPTPFGPPPVELSPSTRRKMMEEAIANPETLHNIFVPDGQDLDWESKVARKFTVQRSNKWKRKKDSMDPEFVKSINDGTEVPQDCLRQMPGTWAAYRLQFHKIMTFYQGVKKRRLHYRNFFAFGDPSLVHLCDPLEFLKNWKGATPEMMKKCLAAHNLFVLLVRNQALSANGLEAFEKPCTDDSTTKGLLDQDQFVKNIDRITTEIKGKQLWGTFAIQADAKRCYVKELKDKLENFTENKGDVKLKESVDKFLASDFAIQAEKDILRAATTNEKLEPRQWNNTTEYTVTRLQIFAGNRREASDMTVGEWDNRMYDDLDGTTTIHRTFTKLEGTLETFLYLDDVESYLLQAYEIARHHQFPDLDKDERRQLQSFFLNANGLPYWRPGQKGNARHLNAWNEITDRLDVATDFRRTMANWSLTADQVTRANSAFVCAHSVVIMTKVYANAVLKQKAGMKVLERYRDEALGRPSTQEGRLKFLKLKIPPELEGRQRRLRIESYDQALSKAVKFEREQFGKQHMETPHKPASVESKASLCELIADERRSGEPVSDKFGFIADVLLKQVKGRKKVYVPLNQLTGAIMSAIDSPRYAENPSAISLKNILIMAAESKISNSVESIEEYVVEKWSKQIAQFGRDGRCLQNFRTKAAFVSLSISAGNENIYSAGNPLISSQVRKMNNARKRLLHDDQSIEQENDDLEQEIVTPNRKSPRLARHGEIQPNPIGPKVVKELSFSTTSSPPKKTNLRVEETEQQEPKTPSPIKVNPNSGLRRQPNWTAKERTTLLGHVLKNMKDPTLGRGGHGKGRSDLKNNVLLKISPYHAEKPEESRNLEELVTQYYRYV